MPKYFARRVAKSAFVLTLFAGFVQAQTITVNELNDELVTDGDCSLREAIVAANTDSAQDGCPAGSGVDTIVLPAGMISMSFPGARNEDAAMAGDLDLLEGVTIQGQGAGVTIIDGTGALAGDGLFEVHSANTHIRGVTMQNIRPWFGYHGAIDVETGGSLVMRESEVLNNAAATSGGGGIWINGTMEIHDSTISGNQAEIQGGGIVVNFGTLRVYSSLISNNNASEAGGIYSNNSTVTIQNSTISGNQSGSGGSGLTVDDFGASNVSFLHGTVAGNSIANGGSAAVAFSNSILSGGVTGNVSSGGYNIVSSGSGFSGTGDQVGANPQLGPLQNNGGATMTHAIASGSPAQDTVTGCGVAKDQRGFSRNDGACDSGAYELGAILPVELASFEVLVDQSSAVLKWRTESETDNAGFDIEHSAGTSRDWEKIDFVVGRGTVSTPTDYTFRLDALTPGVNRFRLRQVDLDGTFAYSDMVEVVIGIPDALDFELSEPYPNPFVVSTTIELVVDRSQFVTATLYNVLGQEIRVLYSGEVASYDRRGLVVGSDDLSSGTYYVRVQGEDFSSVRSVVVGR